MRRLYPCGSRHTPREGIFSFSCRASCRRLSSLQRPPEYTARVVAWESMPHRVVPVRAATQPAQAQALLVSAVPLLFQLISTYATSPGKVLRKPGQVAVVRRGAQAIHASTQLRTRQHLHGMDPARALDPAFDISRKVGLPERAQTRTVPGRIVHIEQPSARRVLSTAAPQSRAEQAMPVRRRVASVHRPRDSRSGLSRRGMKSPCQYAIVPSASAYTVLFDEFAISSMVLR